MLAMHKADPPTHRHSHSSKEPPRADKGPPDSDMKDALNIVRGPHVDPSALSHRSTQPTPWDPALESRGPAWVLNKRHPSSTEVPFKNSNRKT